MTTERARLVTATLCGLVITLGVVAAVFAARGASWL